VYCTRWITLVELRHDTSRSPAYPPDIPALPPDFEKALRTAHGSVPKETRGALGGVDRDGIVGHNAPNVSPIA